MPGGYVESEADGQALTPTLFRRAAFLVGITEYRYLADRLVRGRASKMAGHSPIAPVTLGNMRRLGVRSITVTCQVCYHEATVSAEPWPDDVPVPTFGPRMVCTNCGIVGADARPNWKEYRARGT
jgi:hypothetical protein